MSLGDNDLPLFFNGNEFAVEVVAPVKGDGFTEFAAAQGIADQPSSIFTKSGGSSTELQQVELLLAYDAFDSMPKQGDGLNIGRNEYTVRDREYLDDGKIVKYTLKYSGTTLLTL